jgi:hypothetical protein
MPRGSMHKYFRDQGGSGTDHRGQLLWPGTADGFPVRTDGPIPDLRQAEYEDLPLALDFHSGEFCLWKPEDKARFDAVMDRIVNGWFMQHRRIDKESPDGLKVHLEWVQIYGETATGKSPGASNACFTLRGPGPAPTPPRKPPVYFDQLGWPDESWQPPVAAGPEEA